jgi:hypothetical protein
MRSDTDTDEGSFAELVRTKLAAGDLPVLYPFAPTVTIGIEVRTKTTLAADQRALSEALQDVRTTWQRSVQQVAANARAAALAELRLAPPAPRRRAEALPPNLPPLGLALEEVAAFVGISPNKYKELERRGLMPAPRIIDGRRVYDRELAHAAFKRLPTTDRNGTALTTTATADHDTTWEDIDNATP